MKRQDTDDLIRRLAANAPVVRSLADPWRRTAVWLASALGVVLILVLLSPRPDLASQVTNPRFLAETLTALMTGIAAAIAALTTVVPGRRRKATLMALVPLAAWLGVIGQGCVHDWTQLGPRGRLLHTDWGCFPAILITGALPTVVMAMMLRRGAPLTPTLSMALGGLAAAAIADFGLRFHHHEAGVMVLVWHLGAVSLLTALAGRAGRHVLRWPSSVSQPFLKARA